jgi:LysR family transcriptional regulator, glycine cleavage system transcriptional activator
MSVELVRLASLDLVRGFVAVGRRMSITLAARDLCLTQSAVSRQVHGLEEMLGVKLLVRGHRSITFTPEGERFFRCADAAVQQLQDVVGALRLDAASRPVTITASIGVTGLWLLPRLSDFMQGHPGVDVRLSASNALSDLRYDGIDLAIRYCTPEVAPEGAIRLFGETLAPVAHPSLGLGALTKACELETQILLEFDGELRLGLQWDGWLACQGWTGVRPKGVLRFNRYDQMIQAAIAGQGIALGRLELLGTALANGLLKVANLPQPGPEARHAYWLIRPEGPSRPAVETVADWILAEAARVSG